MRRPIRLAFAAVQLGLLLAACGSPPAPRATARPTPITTPKPVQLFPDSDTPYASASADLQRYWLPYHVATIPGVHALDKIPPAPRVLNATGVVPDSVAQRWGRAFMRTAAWTRWATGAAQGNLFDRLGADASNSEYGSVSNGDVVSRPDCDLFPTQLGLTENPSDGANGAVNQFTIIAEYAGNPCTVTVAQAGQPASTVNSYTTAGFRLSGWLQEDPLLGELWVADRREKCDAECDDMPSAASPPVVAPPALPDTDTPIAQASPPLQQAWGAYGVTTVPGTNTLGDLPVLPAVGNETSGVVTNDQALTWETAYFHDLAWQRWVWRQDQPGLLTHLQDRGTYDDSLSKDANNGGRSSLPACATFPTAISIHANDAGDLQTSSVANSVQYHLDVSYSGNCNVTVVMPDGSRDTIPWATHELVYGSLRIDPILGTIWYALEVVTPNS